MSLQFQCLSVLLLLLVLLSNINVKCSSCTLCVPVLRHLFCLLIIFYVDIIVVMIRLRRIRSSHTDYTEFDENLLLYIMCFSNVTNDYQETALWSSPRFTAGSKTKNTHKCHISFLVHLESQRPQLMVKGQGWSVESKGWHLNCADRPAVPQCLSK